MFNFKDIGDMSKIASQAKEMQKVQNQAQNEQTLILKKISGTLDLILNELKKGK